MLHDLAPNHVFSIISRDLSAGRFCTSNTGVFQTHWRPSISRICFCRLRALKSHPSFLHRFHFHQANAYTSLQAKPSLLHPRRFLCCCPPVDWVRCLTFCAPLLFSEHTYMLQSAFHLSPAWTLSSLQQAHSAPGRRCTELSGQCMSRSGFAE